MSASGSTIRGRGFYTLRRTAGEGGLWAVGLVVAIWTLLPIYHMVMLSFTPISEAFAGRYWADHPTLENYRTVLAEDHFFLQHFWRQLTNSALVALATMALVLIVASLTSFAISRLKLRFGAMATFSIPYAIWVLRQYSDSIPFELDEAAKVDGATPLQIFRMVYIPLLRPALIAIGTYALLLAWNEYLYAFLLLSNEVQHTLPVAMGYFLVTDDSPWPLLMATAIIYALPPAALYYAVRKYMVSGLTTGATKA